MTGYPLWNFPAFDAARDALAANGHHPLSPADMDRFWGFDGTGDIPDWFDRADALLRDFEIVKHADALYLLKGWEASSGASAEVAFATAIGKKFYLEWEGVPGPND